MLQRWSDRVARWLPRPVGLCITRHGFTLRDGRGLETAMTQESPWFDERGRITAAFDFRAVGEALARCAPHAPLHVVLPNPVVHCLTVACEQRVSRRSEVEQLIRWHAERMGIGAETCHFDFCWTGRAAGREQLFAAGAERRLLQQLCAVASPRYVRKTVSGIGALLGIAGKTAGSQLLIDTDRDSWAALALDERGNVRAVRSAWRYAGEDENAVADEARRLMNVLGDEHEPQTVLAWCEPEAWSRLQPALAQRFSRITRWHNPGLQAGFGKVELVSRP